MFHTSTTAIYIALTKGTESFNFKASRLDTTLDIYLLEIITRLTTVIIRKKPFVKRKTVQNSILISKVEMDRKVIGM